MNNLATAYQAAGLMGKALPLCEKTLAKMKAKFGPDHPETLTCMSNLAIAYGKGGGDMAKALLLLHEKGNAGEEESQARPRPPWTRL